MAIFSTDLPNEKGVKTVIVTDAVLRKISEHLIAGLTTDGAHHKQHYIEQALELLGWDLDEIRAEFGCEKGIPD